MADVSFVDSLSHSLFVILHSLRRTTVTPNFFRTFQGRRASPNKERCQRFHFPIAPTAERKRDEQKVGPLTEK